MIRIDCACLLGGSKLILLGLCAVAAPTAFGQQTNPPFEAQSLLEVPNQRPGQAQILPLEQLPANMRDAFSLSARQQANGLEKKTGSLYFVATATPQELSKFERMDPILMRDRSQLQDVFVGQLSDWSAGADTRDLAWVGYTREGSPRGGKVTKISQVYRSPVGEMFALQQWNFAADRISILSAKENMNVSVRGTPGTLVVQTNDTGQTLWTLVWSLGDYYYQLSASGLPVSDASAERLVRMASSVN